MKIYRLHVALISIGVLFSAQLTAASRDDDVAVVNKQAPRTLTEAQLRALPEVLNTLPAPDTARIFPL